MALDLEQITSTYRGEELSLLRDHMNPKLARALKTIGFDPTYVRGQGAYLWDDADNQYLDMLGGYGVFNVGRSHPAIKDAIRQYLELDSPNLIKMGTQLFAGVLAQRLVEVVAIEGLDTVFLCNSGTEAVEGALKFARAYTRRDRIAYCENAFHGLTLGSLSLNGSEHFRGGFGQLLPGCDAVPFGDADALDKELRRGDVAAFVVEPIQGHGVFVPSDDYLPRVRELCDEYGTVFVADEVQTGLGRTGALLACHHWDVAPDIITLSKALSGGYCPVGAIVYPRRIYEKVYSSMDRCIVHSSTFGQNDLAAVCGLATLEVLAKESLAERAAEVGGHLMARLSEMVDRYQMVKEVRGKGLMIAIEFGPPKSLRLKAGWKMIHTLNKELFCQSILVPLMMDHHILAQVAAHGMDTIKLIPPLVLSREDADRFVEAFDRVVGAAHRFPGPIWEVGSRLAKAALT